MINLENSEGSQPLGFGPSSLCAWAWLQPCRHLSLVLCPHVLTVSVLTLIIKL